jgi:cytochrome c biogenesis protein CcmG, thiol:disulfide interchange protein DsbE
MNDAQTLTLQKTKSKTGTIFFVAILGMFALLLLLGWTMIQRAAPPLAQGNAPAFELTSFEGQVLKSSELRGKPIVLNFWASWCVQCRDEAAELQAAWAKYRDQGLMVIGVDYVDTESEAKKYMGEFKITYPNGMDVGTKISSTYRITGVPETYFITRDGKLLSGNDLTGRALGNWIGPVPASAMQERIQRLMATGD